jgi:hypothetical protein
MWVCTTQHISKHIHLFAGNTIVDTRNICACIHAHTHTHTHTKNDWHNMHVHVCVHSSCVMCKSFTSIHVCMRRVIVIAFIVLIYTCMKTYMRADGCTRQGLLYTKKDAHTYTLTHDSRNHACTHIHACTFTCKSMSIMVYASSEHNQARLPSKNTAGILVCIQETLTSI